MTNDLGYVVQRRPVINDVVFIGPRRAKVMSVTLRFARVRWLDEPQPEDPKDLRGTFLVSLSMGIRVEVPVAPTKVKGAAAKAKGERPTIAELDAEFMPKGEA